MKNKKLLLVAVTILSLSVLAGGCGEGSTAPLHGVTGNDPVASAQRVVEAPEFNEDGSYADHVVVKNLPTPFYVEILNPLTIGVPARSRGNSRYQQRFYFFQNGAQIQNNEYNADKFVCELSYSIRGRRRITLPRHVPMGSIGVVQESTCGDKNWGTSCWLKTATFSPIGLYCGLRGATEDKNPVTVGLIREAFGADNIRIMPCPAPSSGLENICHL